MASRTIDLAKAAPAERDAAILAARRKLCEASFREFCKYVKTEEGPLPFWDFQEEIIGLIQQNKSFIWLKRRQIMASWLMAAAALWVAGLHKFSHVALFSKDLEETKELVRRIRIINENMPDWLRSTIRGTRPMACKESKSVIIPFAATQASGIGRSLKLAVFDEFAKHPYGPDNYGALKPAISNSGGMIAICSTSDPLLGASGAMYDFWNDAQDPDDSLKPIFTGATCRADQGADFLAQERKDLKQDHVYYSYYPDRPDQAFLSRAGLVYGIDEADGQLVFDKGRNAVKEFPAWSTCHWRVVGIDPGGADPSAFVPVGVSKVDGYLHPFTDRYHSYYWEENGLTPWHKKGPFSTYELHNMLGELNAWGEIDAVFVDPSQTSVIESLVRYGWPCYPAVNDRSYIFHVRSLFKAGQLTIDERDEHALDELATTEWVPQSGVYARPGRSTNLRMRTPSRHHHDWGDALRYAIAGIAVHYPSADQRRATKGQKRRRYRYSEVGGAAAVRKYSRSRSA